MSVERKLAGVTVLLVDDTDDSRDVLSLVLTALGGATVITAASARQALAKLAIADVDVVVTDIAMPFESGYWLLGEVRRSYGRRLPVLAVSSAASPDDALEAGFDAFLDRPVLHDEICRVVQQLAEARSRASASEDRPYRARIA